ncbi:MAG: hypothetical protein CL758_00610 [Chloroflexi bacterium]|nr:hypothetical protein [Chloroflexota bacterium]
MRFILIVNPYSGKKRSKQILDLIKPVFDSKRIDLAVIFTEFSGHARQLANKLKFDGYDGFLVLGGDGTLNEVVNGMFQRQDGMILPIGLIPGGSGNSIAYDLDLRDPVVAAKAIVNHQNRALDIAQINMGQNVIYSINLIGWGLITDVGKRAESLRWIGTSRYTVSSLIEIMLRKSRKVKLVIDDKTFSDAFTFIVACNSIHIGKGMKMAPYAKLDDGLIDLLVVDANISRRRLFTVLPKLFDGTHVNEPEVTYYQASSFSILSDTDDILNIDGELVGNTPITVTMLKHSVKMFA